MPADGEKIGVLIAVGGPQYRVGSHRQFLLLSRALAEAGYPTLRFDYRGMGDSTGGQRSFEAVNEDVAAAIDAFITKCPSVEQVVLWGLCDAASASLLYWDATHDARVRGMVLLNPWVRSEAGLAKTHIKHYYGQRLLQADFWRKLMSGKLDVFTSIYGLVANLLKAKTGNSHPGQSGDLPFQHKMLRAIQSFSGSVLLILSGNDYTAKEFLEVVNSEQGWQRALSMDTVTMIELPSADHTFSSVRWREEVGCSTKNWLKRHFK